MHACRGHDLTFEEQFVSTACVVCMRCMHSVFSTHPQQAAHPVLEQPHTSRGPAEAAGRGGIQGPDSHFPFGVTPPALRA